MSLFSFLQQTWHSMLGIETTTIAKNASGTSLYSLKRTLNPGSRKVDRMRHKLEILNKSRKTTTSIKKHVNFNRREFACPCCGLDDVSDDLLEALQIVRDALGVPITVTSGVRCLVHNTELGSGKGSSHIKGLAADIAVPSSGYGFLLMKAVFESGKFARVGYGKQGKTLICHLDIDKKKAQNVLWGY